MGMIKLKGTNGSVDESEKLSVQSCNIAADAGSQNDASHRRWEDPSVLKELTDHADGYSRHFEHNNKYQCNRLLQSHL